MCDCLAITVTDCYTDIFAFDVHDVIYVNNCTQTVAISINFLFCFTSLYLARVIDAAIAITFLAACLTDCLTLVNHVETVQDTIIRSTTTIFICQ